MFSIIVVCMHSTDQWGSGTSSCMAGKTSSWTCGCFGHSENEGRSDYGASLISFQPVKFLAGCVFCCCCCGPAVAVLIVVEVFMYFEHDLVVVVVVHVAFVDAFVVVWLC